VTPYSSLTTGKCHGITITPYAAGHTIGGTIWKIRSPSAGTLVYAVNLNHLKERHLDGSVLTLATGGSVFEPLARPDVLITDAERALMTGGRRKDRDKALLGMMLLPLEFKHILTIIEDIITETIASGHSLLLPVDSSTRLLELLVLTDQHWAYSRIRAPICLISNTAKELLAVVRSMMEWLGGTISKEDVGDSGRNMRRRRADDDDEALGALALRFK
jgi:cleavage and polyadenylation specificity factor subunit 2